MLRVCARSVFAFPGGETMFQIEQTYDLASLTVLCRAARKTVRTLARVLRAVCWCIFAVGTALCVLLVLLGGMPDLWMCAVLAFMLALLLNEDRLNAWVALKQLLPGSAHSTTVFADDVYTVTTDTTVTEYRYENITGLCETEKYYLFFLGKKHGQCFDKRGFQQGDPDVFRVWLEERTGKTFQRIK